MTTSRSISDYLDLDGINGLYNYNKIPINSPILNVNANEKYQNYSQLMSELNNPIIVPTFDPSKLQLIPDPAVVVPDYQRSIFPPTPTTRLPITNKVVLVIGGSRNMGKDISIYLSSLGYNTIATSRTPESYTGPNRNNLLSNVPLDIRLKSSVDNFFNKVIKPIGRLDALIICAGVYAVGPLSNYPSELVSDTMELKVFGVAGCVSTALPYLRMNPDGRVIVFTSIFGGEMNTIPYCGSYSLNNHAVDGLIRQYNYDEIQAYSAGVVNNKITYINIQPVLTISNNGLFDYIRPKSQYVTDIVTNPSYILNAGIKAGLTPVDYPVSDTNLMGPQLYDIISAPQPILKYFIGDPSSTIYGLPVGDYVANSLKLYDNDLYTLMMSQYLPLLNATSINSLREGVKNLYFP